MMRFFKYYSLMEILIFIAIGFILLSLVSRVFDRQSDGTYCRGGYKFLSASHGYTQILDEQGHGIPCEVSK